MGIIRTVKGLVKKILPPKIIRRIFRLRQISEATWTRLIFRATNPSDELLQFDSLAELQKQYSFPPEYGYDSGVLDERGRERAVQLLSLIPSAITSSLELGCWDGMVSCHLAGKGLKATGIDARDEGFDKRAIEGGAKLLKMDAAGLDFEDDSFDLVFSYDAFEHFSNPSNVFDEVYRVVKAGGYIYLDFGPLYNSPMGLHAYRQITVPYCQVLFSNETLSQFLSRENMTPLDFNHCNGWSLAQFREIWAKYQGRLQKVKFTEKRDYYHLDLIRKYPGIFRKRNGDFEEFITSSVRVLFKKIA